MQDTSSNPTPAEIEDDLTRVLALAKAALAARDDAAAWSRAPERQIGHHSACCDALWDELERLVDQDAGKVPTIEHPALKERRVAKRIRAQIVSEILDIAAERLEQVIDGGLAWEEPGAMSRADVHDMTT